MKIAISLLAAALCCIPLQAQDIDDVLHNIESNNLTLKAMRHAHEAEILDLKAENTLNGPSVEYSPFYQKGYTGLAESELIVSEEFDFPTRYAARNRQAALQADVLNQQLDGQRKSILLEARLICLDIIRLNQMIDIQQKRHNDSEAMLSLYETRLKAGDANLLEVNRIKLEHQEIHKLVNQSQNERLALLQQLQDLNGGQPVTLTATTYPEQPRVLDFDTFQQQALAANSDILAAEADLRATQHQLTQAKREWLPSLTIGYRRNTSMKEAANGFLVGMSFPLLSTSGKQKAARQRQESAQIALQQSQKTAASTLRSRYQQLITIEQTLQLDDTAMMNETLTLLGKALQHGEITALEYYTEANNIYEKLQSHIDIEHQRAQLLAQLHANSL